MRSKEEKHAYDKMWAVANPERKKEIGRAWYARNRERLNANARARHTANPAKKAAAYQKWRANNPEGYEKRKRAIRERHRERRANDPAYRAKENARGNAWRAANPHLRRTILLKHEYGITEADFLQMLESQNGLCAICGTVAKRWHTDHCHTSKKVRGILCGTCNQGLGLFKENPVFLRAAALYLERHV